MRERGSRPKAAGRATTLIPAARQARAQREIRRAADAAHRPALRVLEVGLPEQVDGERRIHGDEAIDPGEVAQVVVTSQPATVKPVRPWRAR